ncbi:hypothetical protein NCC78_06220 [Micromonospora phytophila]|uniref:hypothetical protein n=1 Tax=Micromonospora phytophila TaxID=709888 RepID=UPI002030CDDC|nr:hypothetical protein [Micromonospora phytophila]MCM0674285.1 hypothetical protein [Micromonospora phytophila]
MTTMWVLLGIVAVLILGTFGYLAWRDRARLSSPEDTTADRDARAVQERYAAERHGTQGETWRRGNDGSGT